MIITLNNIGKTYKTGRIELEALKQVNLQIDKNEFLSIMGPSGSGKSTMMNILGCLDRPTTGEYILDDVNVSAINDRQLAKIRNLKIGFVFQSFNLLPRINALQNVELPMMYAGVSAKERRKRSMFALERVGLSEWKDHKPNEMSGGQKQRIAIARAITNRPSILLADEPTGNLDSTSGEEIMALFQELNQEGATIVVVTHESDIAQHTKRIVRFRDGRLISDEQVGNPLDAKVELANIRKRAPEAV